MCFHSEPTRGYISRTPLDGSTRMFRSRTTPDFPLDENFLSSPINAVLLLATLLGSGGAKGRTGGEIGHALLLRTGISDLNLQPAVDESTGLFNELYNEYTGEETTIHRKTTKNIQINNGIFIQNNYEIKPSFRMTTWHKFFTHVLQVDLSDKTKAFWFFNVWLKRETFGRIPQCFQSPEEMLPSSRLVLLNVLTFIDLWKNGFTTVQSEEFTLKSGTRLNVPMMHVVEPVLYMRSDTMGVVSIRKPFKNTRFSFFLIVPIDHKNTSGMEKVLDGTYPMEFVTRLQEERAVSLKLPKFKLESFLDLTSSLQKFGVYGLFRKDRADLSGITDSERLFVNLWRQINVMTLDESGINIDMAQEIETASTTEGQTEVEVTANTTFAFIIYDEDLRLPILAGRVVKPVF
ncbi:serpin I2 [Clonorchis sinensis]|uniref:Serpin I2 n=1 Tax=Clonorchis sinensis TaxID=79923 RepID=H2KP85_CLOSI|nr:serpin I2 [Clonorchis sinensis]